MSVDHAAVMNSCAQKAWRLGLSALNDVEGVVFLASWVDFEVTCGGLGQFYYNNGGDNAVETVAALRAIGADRAAAALRAANALFPGGTPAKDRAERFEGLQQLRQSSDNPLDDLDSEYYQESDAFSKLCAYIDAHADELREHEQDNG